MVCYFGCCRVGLGAACYLWFKVVLVVGDLVLDVGLFGFDVSWFRLFSGLCMLSGFGYSWVSVFLGFRGFLGLVFVGTLV